MMPGFRLHHVLLQWMKATEEDTDLHIFYDTYLVGVCHENHASSTEILLHLSEEELNHSGSALLRLELLH